MLPTFSIVDFSPYVLGDEGLRRRPDLAAVDRSYRMWAVIEVELHTHPLEHHVFPQVRTFATGRYDESHARQLHEADQPLNLEYLKNLVAFSSPIVTVVVNSTAVLQADWTRLHDECGAQLTFVESFRSRDDDVVVAVSGYLPNPPPSRVIELKKHRMLNALFCNLPSQVPSTLGECIQIWYRDRRYRWSVIRTKDAVVFFVPSGCEIRPDRNYELCSGTDDRYLLRQL